MFWSRAGTDPRARTISEARGIEVAMKSLTRPSPALLHDLYDLPEPVVSVYFGMEERAGDDVDLRRRVIRHRLLRAATGSTVVEAVEDALSEVPRGPGMLAAFVGHDGSQRSFEMPEADLADRVTRAALPDVVPFLRWRQYRPPYVLAVLDRTGAEVSVRVSPENGARTATVPGPDDVIERNAPGGPSQGRYQNRAEDSWLHNSARTARAVTAALSDSGARLLILAGDVRAVRYFRDKLPEWVREEVRVAAVPGGRHADGSEVLREANLDRTVRTMVDARLREAVADVVDQSGPGGLGVQGLPAVIHALARGQIHKLLIAPDTDAATAWFGPGVTDISEHRSRLAAQDADRRHGPVADVLIRTATLTDAEVGILPLGLSEYLRQGVGGICRYAG